MRCPRCNREYDRDFDTCLVCGCPLEEYVPILSREEEEVLDLEDSLPDTDALTQELLPELLVSVMGKEEARRLAALLQEYRIPCMCRLSQNEAETQDAASGEAVYDLLIPKMLFPKAVRILNEDAAAITAEEGMQEEALWEGEPAEEQSGEEKATASGDLETPIPKKKKRWGIFGKKD